MHNQDSSFFIYGTSLVQACGYCDEILTHADHDCLMADFASAISEDFHPEGYVEFGYSEFSRDQAKRFLANPKFAEFRDLYRNGTYISSHISEQENYADYDYDNSFPIPDLEGVSVTDISSEDEWDGIYASRDNYQTMTEPSYRDLDPRTCTTVRNWYIPGVTPDRVRYRTEHFPKGFSAQTSYEQREALDFNERGLSNLTFTELQGFVSTKLIDANITEAYQFKFFNIYNGRDGKLHIGLLTFDQSVDGRPQVTCKHNGCFYKHTPFVFSGNPDDRNDLEDFVTACIRHGNNHGPSWYLNRSDFTYMHAQNCDSQHPTSQACNTNRQFTTRADLLGSFPEAFQFLINHRKYCSDNTCRCTHYYHLLSEHDRTLESQAA